MNGLQYGIRFFTNRPADQLEDWLNRHCGDGWDLQLAGIGEDRYGNMQKQLLVLFRKARDRELFQHGFLHH